MSPESSAESVGRILVTGHRGMLGKDLINALAINFPQADLSGLDLPELDIRDGKSVDRVMRDMRPGMVVNCAAYTNVDGCETERELAMAVNGEGPGHLARATRQTQARLIHVSTDFVFDGKASRPYREEDEPNPLSVYGASKLAGERAVQAEGGEWVIARTAWLYGRHGKNFVDTMLRLAREKEELSVVTDQIGSPTWTRDLAEAICALIRSGATGIFHTVNAGACSRFDQVAEIVRAAGLSTRLKPTDSSAFPRAAEVPACSPLDTSKLARETGHVMRPWDEALREYVGSG